MAMKGAKLAFFGGGVLPSSQGPRETWGRGMASSIHRSKEREGVNIF